MQLTRRTLLATVAPAAVALAVAGCSTTQIAGFETAWAAIVSEVQAGVAAAANYIPTIESVAATAASLFGPAWEAAVAAGSIVVNQIIATLVNVVGALTPPASHALRVRLRASSLNTPVVIGTTAGGVTVTGYRV